MDLCQTLLETMSVGVLFVAPDGRIAQANPAAVQMLRLPRAEIEACHYTEVGWLVLRPDSTPRPYEERVVQRALEERQPVANIEMPVLLGDDGNGWVSGSATPLVNAAGALEGVVASFIDTTASHEMQNLLQLQRDLVVTVLAQDTLEAALQKLLALFCRIPGSTAAGSTGWMARQVVPNSWRIVAWGRPSWRRWRASNQAVRARSGFWKGDPSTLSVPN